MPKKPQWLIDALISQPYSGQARIIIKKNLGKVLFWKVHFNDDVVQLIVEQQNVHNFDALRLIRAGSCVRFTGKKCR